MGAAEEGDDGRIVAGVVQHRGRRPGQLGFEFDAVGIVVDQPGTLDELLCGSTESVELAQ
ncbi:hypothetical protein ACWEO2_29490 [Nocardia sp. NPDC004278]